jgi:hypothetical protein
MRPGPGCSGAGTSLSLTAGVRLTETVLRLSETTRPPDPADQRDVTDGRVGTNLGHGFPDGPDRDVTVMVMPGPRLVG